MSVSLRLSASLALLALVASACGKAQDHAPAPSSASAGSSVVAATPGSNAKVARIAFVDQQEACDCTKARIDGTWAALQQAMAGSRSVPVERVHADVDELRGSALEKAKPVLVYPALYFFDEAGNLLDMMQGELKQEDLEKRLR